MGKKKTIQNLRVGVFNDLPSQKNYGLVTDDVAPKWAQNVNEKQNVKTKAKTRTTEGRNKNSVHRD